MTVTRAAGLASAALLAITMSACSATGAASDTVTGALTIAVLAPFTGADGQIGPYVEGGCKIGASAVNNAGGVLGHQVTCVGFDTVGDPADAVPAARKMFATSKNLSLVLGATSDEASAVVPIINDHKMVVFASTGQAEFSQSKFPYFYRLTPADSEQAVAMVAAARDLGYKNIALVFGNDIGSQSFVGPATSAIHAAGMNLVDSVTLDLKASSYRTEVAQLISKHPDAIITETAGQTAITFNSEVKSLNGKLIDLVANADAVGPDYFTPMAAAVGAADLAKAFHAATLTVPSTGPSYDAYKTALSQTSLDPTNYLQNPNALRQYDSVVIAALAMVEAKSTIAAEYNKYIVGLANGETGAVDVTTFADGVKELAAGKKIHYVAAGGPIKLDAAHNNSGTYNLVGYDPTGAVTTLATIPASELDALTAH